MPIVTDNTGTLVNALEANSRLEAANKDLRNQIETLQEALDGAHRVIRQLRDKDSDLGPLDNSVPIP